MPATSTSRARVIAIDGPAASGKSVVGNGVAKALRYHFFDTGAMYRAMTWLALKRGIDTRDRRALAELARNARVDAVEAPDNEIERTRVLVDGDDATPHLRDTDVESNVSLVARVQAVRDALVRIQRGLATDGGVVMAGRDIGTVVLPGADLKVYLEASARVRAERRVAQLQAAGFDANVEALVADLARRDHIDSTREISPLTPADDAVIINTDSLSIDQVIERIVELAA
jgi:cytidylate kinase